MSFLCQNHFLQIYHGSTVPGNGRSDMSRIQQNNVMVRAGLLSIGKFSKTVRRRFEVFTVISVLTSIRFHLIIPISLLSPVCVQLGHHVPVNHAGLISPLFTSLPPWNRSLWPRPCGSC